MSETQNDSSGPQVTVLQRVEGSRADWTVFRINVGRPVVCLPIFFAVCATVAGVLTKDNIFSVIMTVLASLSSAIAGAAFYDFMKEASGNTVLIKKGKSAVRNLSLARTKVKNISGRAENGAQTPEIINLLGLLEKDVANSTQEWNDVVPGLDHIEEIYTMLAEKEEMFAQAREDKEKTDRALVEQKTLSEERRRKLEEISATMDELSSTMQKDILRLQSEVARATTTATSSVGTISFAGSTGPSGGFGMGTPVERLGGFGMGTRTTKLSACSNCRRLYTLSEEAASQLGLCPECYSKHMNSAKP